MSEPAEGKVTYEDLCIAAKWLEVNWIEVAPDWVAVKGGCLPFRQATVPRRRSQRWYGSPLRMVKAR
jgi:hypothetical protein